MELQALHSKQHRCAACDRFMVLQLLLLGLHLLMLLRLLLLLLLSWRL
jgi:hypothetical protein